MILEDGQVIPKDKNQKTIGKETFTSSQYMSISAPSFDFVKTTVIACVISFFFPGKSIRTTSLVESYLKLPQVSVSLLIMSVHLSV